MRKKSQFELFDDSINTAASLNESTSTPAQLILPKIEAGHSGWFEPRDDDEVQAKGR